MIDLRALAADRGVRCALPDWAKGEPAEDRPWLWAVPCMRGEIGVHSADLLSATATGRAAHALRALPGVHVVQDGDRECTVTFPPEEWDAVGAVVHPRRKRVGRPLSPEERDRLVAAGAAHRFTGR